MRQKEATLLVLVVLLMFVPLFMHSPADFQGADDQTTKMIVAVKPGYEAWFAPFFEPSEDLQPWLFAFQAGIGAGVVCYILGYLRGLTDEGATRA
jgi:cobalt/nickel transport protein